MEGTIKLDAPVVNVLTTRKGPTKITVHMGSYSIEAELHRDGNKFCILLGEDLQSGFAVFGSSIIEAVKKFQHDVDFNLIPAGAKI